MWDPNPLWIKVDLGVMALKGYLTFPKAPGQEPHHQIQFSVISKTLINMPLPLCSDAAVIFYNCNQLGCMKSDSIL